MSENAPLPFTKILGYVSSLVILFAIGTLSIRLSSSREHSVYEPADNVVSSEVDDSIADPEMAREIEVTTQPFHSSHDDAVSSHLVDRMGETSALNQNEKKQMTYPDHENGSAPVLLRQVSTEFRSNPGFREESAQQILPYITTEMTREDVLRLLGEPSAKDSGGREWIYTVFYSKYISVYFNAQSKVERVVGVGVEAKK